MRRICSSCGIHGEYGWPRELCIGDRAVGVWGSVAALAGGLGPPLGSAVIELGGWRWIFFINIPVVLIVVVLGRNVLRESKGSSTGTRLDMVSVPLGTIGLALLTLGVLQGEQGGGTMPGSLASVVGVIVFGWIWLLYKSCRAAALKRLGSGGWRCLKGQYTRAARCARRASPTAAFGSGVA